MLADSPVPRPAGVAGVLRSPGVRYQRVNSTSSLPLVVPRPTCWRSAADRLRSCTITYSRRWVSFVLLLGDPLVTCQALFGGLLLTGGTVMTSLSYLPLHWGLNGGLVQSMNSARVLGPVTVALGVLFLATSIVNHRILLSRQMRRQRRKHRRSDDLGFPPSVRRAAERLPSARRETVKGPRPPVVANESSGSPSAQQVAVVSPGRKKRRRSGPKLPPSTHPQHSAV